MKYKIGQKIRYVYSYETKDLKTNHVYTITDIIPYDNIYYSIEWCGSNNNKYRINSYDCNVDMKYLIPISKPITLEIL